MDRKLWQDFDYILLSVTLLLLAYGAAMVYSATLDPTQEELLSETMVRHLISIGIGIVAMAAVTLIDYHVLARFSKAFYALAIGLLVAIFAIGQVFMGAQRWLATDLFTIQTSEPVKFLLILVLAKYLSDNQSSMGRLRTVLISLLLVSVPLVLIYLQPNLSTALVVFTVWLVMLIMAGMRWQHLLALGGLGVIAAPLIWLSMRPYMRERVLVYLNPGQDPAGAGYNPMQALVSIGSGGWLGKGFASGTQSQLHFLRVRHTDFIFSVTCEELGFVGGLIMFALLAIILFRIIRAARLSRDIFGQQIALGVATVILFQSFANIGMNLGMLPAAGLPLPFVSYGGSYLIPLLAALGLIQSIIVHQRPLDFWSRPKG
jgi:rod shape determining protein RodA